MGNNSGFAVSKFVERDIISKIAEKLASIPYEDIDLFFDYFLTAEDLNRISKKRFKEVVLLNLNV